MRIKKNLLTQFCYEIIVKILYVCNITLKLNSELLHILQFLLKIFSQSLHFTHSLGFLIFHFYLPFNI